VTRSMDVSTNTALPSEPTALTPTSLRCGDSPVSDTVPTNPVAAARLFPMQLAAFEQYMLIDDHPDYPITFFIQFRLLGQLNIQAIADAYREAVLRHPLLCCRVERRSGRYYWIWSPDSIIPAQMNPHVWKETRPWLRSIDLTQQTGIRIWGEATEDHAEVTLQFHHACCDGIGASQFLEDIAICYARRTTGDATLPELRPLNPEALINRSDPGPRRIAHLPGPLPGRLLHMLKDAVKYLTQRNEVLKAMPEETVESPPEGFQLQTDSLDRATTRRLRNAASRRNVTLNDILIRDLMETLAAWNKESGGARRRGLICILTPSSLRGPVDEMLPAANVVGYAFPSRGRDQMKVSEELLDDLSGAMNRFLQSQHGWLFVQALTVVRRIPFLLALSTRLLRHQCMSTAVLSHLGNKLNSVSSRLKAEGDVIHVGNTTLDEIRCIPPLRHGTHAALATCVFGGKLMINLRCDPKTFGRQQTRLLLDRYLARLRQSAEQSVPQ
jgi:hypothetical protein